MIYFSDLQPLFFNLPIAPREDFVQEAYMVADGTDVTKVGDMIPLQILTDGGENVEFYTLLEDNTRQQFYTESYDINNEVTVYYMARDTLHPSLAWCVGHSVRIMVRDVTHGKDYISQPVFFTDCDELRAETLLIRYGNNSNVTGYNTAFLIGGDDVIFEWRVPGSINSGGFSTMLDGEEFRNQRQEEVQLFGIGYGKHTLTLGGVSGAPWYYADLLNKVLTCDFVTIYNPSTASTLSVRRSGSSTPELQETFAGSGLYFITQEIEIINPIIQL